MRLLSIFRNLTGTLITLLHYVDKTAVCAALCFIQNKFEEKLEVYERKLKEGCFQVDIANCLFRHPADAEQH